MPLMQRCAAMAHVVVAHLAFDATRVALATTADTATAGDRSEHRFAPSFQALRGKWPRLAAIFV